MPRGRRKLEFRADPDRHLLALAFAYRWLGMSLRGGCEAAVATTEGLPVGPNLKRGRGGHGLNLLDWRFELKCRPGAAVTIEGRARGLRQKIKKWQRDPEAMRWLATMQRAVLLALQTWVPDPTAADAEITRLTREAGEAGYGQKLLQLARGVRLREQVRISHPTSRISHPRSRV
jgi:hypothetical protein